MKDRDTAGRGVSWAKTPDPTHLFFSYWTPHLRILTLALTVHTHKNRNQIHTNHYWEGSHLSQTSHLFLHFSSLPSLLCFQANPQAVWRLLWRAQHCTYSTALGTNLKPMNRRESGGISSIALAESWRSWVQCLHLECSCVCSELDQSEVPGYQAQSCGCPAESPRGDDSCSPAFYKTLMTHSNSEQAFYKKTTISKISFNTTKK